MKRICFYAAVLVVCGLNSLAGQNAKGTSLCWLEVIADEIDFVRVAGRFYNVATKEQELSYRLVVERVKQNEKSRQVQTGNFNVQASQTVNLRGLRVNKPVSDIAKISLIVWAGSQEIARDSLEDLARSTNKQTQSPLSVPNTKVAPSGAHTRSPKEINPAGNPDLLEIGGLIIDDTRSKTGRDFYDQFYAKWFAPPGISDFTLTIKELPARGRMANVAIFFNDQQLMQRTIQPRAEVVEQQAEVAVNAIRNYLIKNENLKKDLGDPDQEGSGIF